MTLGKWREPLTDEKLFKFFSSPKWIMPIIEIVFPQSLYLFYCTIPNDAGGDETTFAIAVIHH
jgi:hypothetical protein